MELEQIVKIFVLNRGSSSIKCYLYDLKSAPHHSYPPIWQAHLQWKNQFEGATLSINGEQTEAVEEKTAASVFSRLMRSLAQKEKIDVIGHRIVHGGKYFKESVLINRDVKEKIGLLAELAPLHNLPELEGIEVLEQLFEKTPQIAVFDTAFHHSLPRAAQIYPGPYHWVEEDILRYGFHGISFQYCSRRAAELLNRDIRSLKMIICHLGSGASLCAIKEGKSIDTTMGFTPLEGLMMDTRSGSIDPGIILHLLEKKKMSPKEVSEMLYKKSGLIGLSGISSDMRDIIKKKSEGNLRAALAFDVYIHRLSACIGSMLASLNGVDVLVFTAGIGENAPLIRERICNNFSFLGGQLDRLKNEQPSREDIELSQKGSKVSILLIHTQEAFEIAHECWKISLQK